MQREIKSVNTLDEGEHHGVITAVEERQTSQEYAYLDVFIEASGNKIKTSFSDYVSENSALGELLVRFGNKLLPGDKIEPDKCLIGQMCSFSVIKQLNKKDGKTYANVINDTLRPTKDNKIPFGPDNVN